MQRCSPSKTVIRQNSYSLITLNFFLSFCQVAYTITHLTQLWRWWWWWKPNVVETCFSVYLPIMCVTWRKLVIFDYTSSNFHLHLFSFIFWWAIHMQRYLVMILNDKKCNSTTNRICSSLIFQELIIDYLIIIKYFYIIDL